MWEGYVVIIVGEYNIVTIDYVIWGIYRDEIDIFRHVIGLMWGLLWYSVNFIFKCMGMKWYEIGSY